MPVLTGNPIKRVERADSDLRDEQDGGEDGYGDECRFVSLVSPGLDEGVQN
jgi:hypothetical protein